MKTQLKLLSLALLLSTLNHPLSTAFGQGALTPPGAPVPTMKSLDQIYAKLDPRIAIATNTTPGDGTDLYVISQPGSYYLTTNLTGVSGKNGIEITANNVTLDLNGFTLQGVPGTQSGIFVPNAQTNLTVRNGALSIWGYAGVYSISASSMNVVLEQLNVSASQGLNGIWVQGPGVVRDCNSHNNYYSGIACIGGGMISGCTANNNVLYGIADYFGAVTGCHAQNNGLAGFYTLRGTISGCTAANNGGYGIQVNYGTVAGCNVQSNSASGIYVFADGCQVTGNTCVGNNAAANAGNAGIYVTSANNRIEGNQVSSSGIAGISVNSGYANNIIVKNSVSGNGANNYLTPGTQVVGPLITVTGTITNLNPWANFSF